MKRCALVRIFFLQLSKLTRATTFVAIVTNAFFPYSKFPIAYAATSQNSTKAPQATIANKEPCVLKNFYKDLDGDNYFSVIISKCVVGSEVPAGYVLDQNDGKFPAGKDCNDDPKTGSLIWKNYTFNAMDKNGDGKYQKITPITKCLGDTLPKQYASMNWADKAEAAAKGQSAKADNLCPAVEIYSDKDNDAYYNILKKARVCGDKAPSGYKFSNPTVGLPKGKDCNDNPLKNGANEFIKYTFNAVDKNGDGRFQKLNAPFPVYCANESFINTKFKKIDWNNPTEIKKYGQTPAADNKAAGAVTQVTPVKPGPCRSATLYTDNDGDGYFGVAISKMICNGVVPSGYSLANAERKFPKGKDCDDDPLTGMKKYQLLPYNAIDKNGDGYYQKYDKSPIATICTGSKLPSGYAKLDWNNQDVSKKYGQSTANDNSTFNKNDTSNFTFDDSKIIGHSDKGVIQAPLKPQEPVLPQEPEIGGWKESNVKIGLENWLAQTDSKWKHRKELIEYQDKIDKQNDFTKAIHNIIQSKAANEVSIKINNLQAEYWFDYAREYSYEYSTSKNYENDFEVGDLFAKKLDSEFNLYHFFLKLSPELQKNYKVFRLIINNPTAYGMCILSTGRQDLVPSKSLSLQDPAFLTPKSDTLIDFWIPKNSDTETVSSLTLGIGSCEGKASDMTSSRLIGIKVGDDNPVEDIASGCPSGATPGVGSCGTISCSCPSGTHMESLSQQLAANLGLLNGSGGDENACLNTSAYSNLQNRTLPPALFSNPGDGSGAQTNDLACVSDLCLQSNTVYFLNDHTKCTTCPAGSSADKSKTACQTTPVQLPDPCLQPQGIGFVPSAPDEVWDGNSCSKISCGENANKNTTPIAWAVDSGGAHITNGNAICNCNPGHYFSAQNSKCTKYPPRPEDCGSDDDPGDPYNAACYFDEKAEAWLPSCGRDQFYNAFGGVGNGPGCYCDPGFAMKGGKCTSKGSVKCAKNEYVDYNSANWNCVNWCPTRIPGSNWSGSSCLCNKGTVYDSNTEACVIVNDNSEENLSQFDSPLNPFSSQVKNVAKNFAFIPQAKADDGDDSDNSGSSSSDGGSLGDTILNIICQYGIEYYFGQEVCGGDPGEEDMLSPAGPIRTPDGRLGPTQPTTGGSGQNPPVPQDTYQGSFSSSSSSSSSGGGGTSTPPTSITLPFGITRNSEDGPILSKTDGKIAAEIAAAPSPLKNFSNPLKTAPNGNKNIQEALDIVSKALGDFVSSTEQQKAMGFISWMNGIFNAEASARFKNMQAYNALLDALDVLQDVLKNETKNLSPEEAEAINKAINDLRHKCGKIANEIESNNEASFANTVSLLAAIEALGNISAAIGIGTLSIEAGGQSAIGNGATAYATIMAIGLGGEAIHAGIDSGLSLSEFLSKFSNNYLEGHEALQLQALRIGITVMLAKYFAQGAASSTGSAAIIKDFIAYMLKAGLISEQLAGTITASGNLLYGIADFMFNPNSNYDAKTLAHLAADAGMNLAMLKSMIKQVGELTTIDPKKAEEINKLDENKTTENNSTNNSTGSNAEAFDRKDVQPIPEAERTTRESKITLGNKVTEVAKIDAKSQIERLQKISDEAKAAGKDTSRIDAIISEIQEISADGSVEVIIETTKNAEGNTVYGDHNVDVSYDSKGNPRYTVRLDGNRALTEGPQAIEETLIHEFEHVIDKANADKALNEIKEFEAENPEVRDERQRLAEAFESKVADSSFSGTFESFVEQFGSESVKTFNNLINKWKSLDTIVKNRKTMEERAIAAEQALRFARDGISTVSVKKFTYPTFEGARDILKSGSPNSARMLTSLLTTLRLKYFLSKKFKIIDEASDPTTKGSDFMDKGLEDYLGKNSERFTPEELTKLKEAWDASANSPELQPPLLDPNNSDTYPWDVLE